jgi:competence protein ComEA
MGFCFLLLIIRICYPSFIRPKNIIVANLPLLEKKNEGKIQVNNELFVFDPNSVSEKQLISLGFKEKTAATFIKFRSGGFVFKHKEDLKKVYGLTEKLYDKIEPYIFIRSTEKTATAKHIKYTVKEKIELNSADSIQLLAIRGVGPSFAKRILKYRSILGGYASVEQLKEVYGFTEEMFEQIAPQVSVDISLITKINLNKDDFKVVNKHPYITYEVTKMIFEKRRREIITPEVFMEILNDNTIYKKLEPYLIF